MIVWLRGTGYDVDDAGKPSPSFLRRMVWNTLLGWVSILALVLGISMWAYFKCRVAFGVRSGRSHYLFLIILGRTVTRELISWSVKRVASELHKGQKVKLRSVRPCPRLYVLVH